MPGKGFSSCLPLNAARSPKPNPIPFTMIQQIEKIGANLLSDMEQMDTSAQTLEKLTLLSQRIESAFKEINELLHTQLFGDDTEEIKFFKQVKPKLLAMKIGAVYKYHIHVNKPIATLENQLGFFEKEIEALNSFFRLNNFHYQYYKNGLSQLDHTYFLRDAGPLTVPVAEIIETGAGFSTPMSNLFAKFIAFENVQHFITEKIIELKQPEDTLNNRPAPTGPDLKWTGDAVNIIEVAYGFFLTGQLNNGNASLNQIVRWLEKNLKVNIGNVQSRFAEIGSRKRLSTTKFMDQMTELIQKKIEQDYS